MSIEPRSHETVLPRTISMHSCNLVTVAGSSSYCGALGERGETGNRWGRRKVVVLNKVGEYTNNEVEVREYNTIALAISSQLL